ncbi:hypothetical protein DFH09DRAFT_946720 [Mycena vulgaris]|nr:hypothetical protein DFH09DRAFT_946720 [Mycena vulgaris]
MESPFQSILFTNAVPSDGDCARIRELLTSPRKQVADLTQEIDEIQNQLDGLTQRRDELNQLIDAHLSLVSPARRLPEDIVRTQCLQSTMP